MNYTKAVEYIENIPRFAIAEPLAHAQEMLRRVDNPQDKLRVIHVAGTNGKGSVCAYLAAILQEGGLTCGLFTSPHLVKMNERFKINGVMVDDETFLRLFLRVKQVIDDFVLEGREHPSYFEVVFVMGMLYFQEQAVDIVVMETGLGGRLDATNTVKKPLACIITSISLDHTEYLGETVAAIAGEKAGIIKPGVPVIYDAANKEAAAVIRKAAENRQASAYPLDETMYKMIQNTPEGIDFSFCCKYYNTITCSIPYIAPYQMVNASLALYAMVMLRDTLLIPAAVLPKGIAKTRWEGRMETVLPGIILDGAHNEDGIRRFVETALAFRDHYRITILFSAVADKKYQSMIQLISDAIQPDAVVATQIDGGRIVSAEELAKTFVASGCRCVYSEADIVRAYEQACQLREGGLLFCVGSLYLIGDIKKYLKEKDKTLGGNR